MTLLATDKEKEEVESYLEWQLEKTSEKTVAIKHVEKIIAEYVAGARYEAIAMRLRESLVALFKVISDGDLVPPGEEKPQDANHAWLGLLADRIASGSSNSRLRSYLRNMGAETTSALLKSFWV